jgi:hypothetical protein
MALARIGLGLSLLLFGCAEATSANNSGGQNGATSGTGGMVDPPANPSPSPTSSTGNGGTPTPNNNSSDPACDPTQSDLRDCPCDSAGATRACYTGPAGSAHVGACKDGQQTCVTKSEFLLWGPCTGDVTPAAEICSQTTDENCNGKVGCADSACTGIAGCCAPGDKRSCYDGPTGTDGVGLCAAGTQECDAAGAWKACGSETLPSSEAGHCTDGNDNDCDGLVDCKDPECTNDPACKPPICTPGATKGCYDGAAVTAGVGQCHGGNLTCDASGQAWGTTCAGEVLPGNEAGHCHDGVDNDCNGLKDCQDPACNGDPGCACTPNSVRSCYTGPAGTENVGQCKSGSQTCNAAGSAWGTCLGSVLPSIETGACADNVDNDCDGQTDCADANCTFAANCCVPTTSYDATIFATSATSLYVINPADWSETKKGTYGVNDNMTDIAMTPDGELYTLSSTSLYWIDRNTGAATFLLHLSGSLNNALTFLPDNRLLAADASGQLKVIDPSVGTVTNIGKYGFGYGSSGDLVAVGDGTMFGISATSKTGADISSNNLLVTIDTGSGAATPVGSTGFGNVFGIAYYGSRVLAFTYTGQIIEINPVTGAGKLLATHSSHPYFGGTTSPLIPINGCM